jgi:hypothetical protein
MLAARAAPFPAKQLPLHGRTEATAKSKRAQKLEISAQAGMSPDEKNPRVWGRRPGDGGEGRWAENFFKLCRG